MKISNYQKSKSKISYTISVEDHSLNVEHIRTEYGSVQTTGTDDFLCGVEEEFGYNHANMAEEFINFQIEMLLYRIPFEWEG